MCVLVAPWTQENLWMFISSLMPWQELKEPWEPEFKLTTTLGMPATRRIQTTETRKGSVPIGLPADPPDAHQLNSP